MLLVNREPQVEQLQLAIVTIEHVPPCGTLLPSTTYILPQTVESNTLLGIALRIIAIGILNIALERRHPVNLVGGLERHRDHGRLRHLVRRTAQRRVSREPGRSDSMQCPRCLRGDGWRKGEGGGGGGEVVARWLAAGDLRCRTGLAAWGGVCRPFSRYGQGVRNASNRCSRPQARVRLFVSGFWNRAASHAARCRYSWGKGGLETEEALTADAR